MIEHQPRGIGLLRGRRQHDGGRRHDLVQPSFERVVIVGHGQREISVRDHANHLFAVVNDHRSDVVVRHRPARVMDAGSRR
jgi:hypothetical protein